MRLLVQHRSRYAYPEPAALGPHVFRLRPANHAKARIETYGLHVSPEGAMKWQQDPYGNHVARVTWKAGTRMRELDVLVEFSCDVRPVNPFDFFVDDRCKKAPFVYPAEMRQDLRPFLDAAEASVAGGPLLAKFLAGLPREGETVPLVVALNAAVNGAVRYVIREEAGIWTPEETLGNGRGSCRDSAVLLIAALRSRGLAARFVSGYLIQLTDEGMIPDAPKGMGRDVVDLHAWAEVFIPGAGWIGLDATSGLLCGEGHIPLACTAVPPLAAPVEGTSDVVATGVTFSMTVGRLGHEPRPTRPYEDDVWQELLSSGERVDERLKEAGLSLTIGGEPTFNSREHPDLPEWNGEALGATKWEQGKRLVNELRLRLAPDGAVLRRFGKLYPGETLPRWALDVVGRRDGVALWPRREGLAEKVRSDEGRDDAHLFAEALAARLGLSADLQPAYEDPWRAFQDEASLPVDVDPLEADLDDPEERRRLARILDKGLGREAGWVLPLLRADKAWTSERWSFRRGHLFLVPGDSPIGLRLPLGSLGPGAVPSPFEEPVDPPDPRREESKDDAGAEDSRKAKDAGVPPETEALEEKRTDKDAPRDAKAAPGTGRTAIHVAPPPSARRPVRTALSVEVRDGELHVFLPPVATAEDFEILLAEVEATRAETGLDVALEGYPPPSSKKFLRFSVTPDPGVLEVNLPPSSGLAEHAALVDTVFDAALHAGLHSEKYLLDGRMSGSGGGNHITLGGPAPLESPFLKRPDLLASLVTFFQHHPSLSYLFTGLFVGPTSQAPRVDEARHDSLYELEIALAHAFSKRGEATPPWLPDILFRHLLVDVAGNTHRAEISIDKLFDPQGAHGRQGLVELRAFEMPAHPRMVTAQAALARALVAAFATEPYQAPLVRWGQTLHDRFLLPTYLWRDFEEVLAFLAGRGVPLPAEAFRAFVDFRCPVVGELSAEGVTLEIRNAIEPWPVLGEELTATGTSRYVDSSMERVEVRASGLVPERHLVLVNGLRLPLRPTGFAAEAVGGVRFRAWAPPHSLHAHIGIHHPLRFDLLDTWGRRSLGACAYHVWHPEGRAFEAAPLTRFEASARRAQRFTHEGPLPWPVRPVDATPHPDAPYTLDLRRYPIDRPPPEPEEEEPSS